MLHIPPKIKKLQIYFTAISNTRATAMSNTRIH